ncbi:D-alanyl-D-alanine carboxypeptidase family protein [Candidatus Contubernalis alkaliaceticus]|uniref:D-alanyl-D-alanine carboxypeptidase family protein n=1 Tax=Candidatus Contubernalis alkaliaceticus TaxID=338645 RepID=UPI001F4C0741|nr:D-alanyl-D-alanine carboxypeptidase family protein [Candidatus Contubernalis alkalaceticus]UNC92988.1 D-alanyl-D-alanine carboxypeptidase [Candidatus Contubernalis alkalaceticus]
MIKLKKLALLLLIFSLFFLSLTPLTAWAEPDTDATEEELEDELPFDVDAKSALLMEATTGEILYEKDADAKYPPASITKIMTLLIALEAIEEGKTDWNDTVEVSENAWRMKGSEMFLEIGQEVTVDQLLQGISVVSANDACVALAEHLYGSEEMFVQIMNQKAQQLGMKNSHFENTTGLPHENHYMSARDIAILSAYTINNYPKILELESQREFTFNDIVQYNRNPLLGRFPGADGLKTGWTTEAGYCLAGTAKQNNFRLISVILNSPNLSSRLSSTEAVLNYGFRNYIFKVMVDKGEVVGEAPVPDGKDKEVAASTQNSLGAVITLPDEDRLETQVIYDKLSAPIEKGDRVGEMHILLENEILSRVTLVAEQDIEKTNFAVIALRQVGGFFKNMTTGLVDMIKGIFE